MSEPGQLRALRCGAALLLALIAPAPAATQDGVPPRDLAAAQARVAELTAEFRRADSVVDRARAARLDSITREALREPLDTGRVGPLLVVGPRSLLPEAVRWLEGGWREFEPLVGDAPARRPPTPVLLTYREPVRIYETMRRRPAHYHVRIPRWIELEHFEAAAVQPLSTVLGASLPHEVSEWLGARWLGNPRDQERVYRELALSRSTAGRGCYQGDVTSCRHALSLSGPGEDWSNWYSPLQLREIVAQRVLAAGRVDPVRDRCLAGDHAACVTFLRTNRAPPAPLGVLARASFLLHVLRRSGPAGFERLLAGEGTAEERLARAAGGSLDAALAEWRAGLDAVRPAAGRQASASRLAAVFWFLILGGLAMRSTRWRLR